MVLTDEMKKMVDGVRLAFVATSSKSGIPNVSPKGSIRIVDDETVAFSCVNSAKSMANIKENPNVALAVVDTNTRKGFQFKGTGTLEDKGALYEEMAAGMEQRKIPRPKFIMKIKVTEYFKLP